MGRKVIKAVTAADAIVLMYAVSAVDALPLQVSLPLMAVTGGWLVLLAYVRGWFD